LEDGGASGTTRRPLIIALDEAIEKYLEEMSSDVMEERRGTAETMLQMMHQ